MDKADGDKGFGKRCGKSALVSNNLLRNVNKIIFMRSQQTPERKSATFKYTSSQGSNLYGSESRTSEYIDKLFAECSLLKNKLQETEQNYSRTMLENRNLADRLKSSENQVINLKLELENTLATIKEISYENHGTSEDMFSLKQTCASFESKNIMLQNEINRLRLELQKTTQQKQSLESQLALTNKEIVGTKTELEATSSAKQRLGSQLDSYTRQIEILQNENKKLLSLREEDRRAVIEYEVKVNDLEEELRQCQDKIRFTVKENQNWTETIREKTEEIRSKESNKRTLENEIKDLRVYIEKYESAQDEIRKLKDFIEDIKLELRKAKQENDETKSALKYKEEEIWQYKNHLEQAKKDLESAKKYYEDERSKAEGYTISLRNITYLEQQLQQFKMQTEESQSRERHLHQEYEQLQSSYKKSEDKLSHLLRQIDSNQSQKLSIEADNIKLQKNLSELLTRDSNKNLELSKNEVKIKQLSLELDEMHIKLRKCNDEIYAIRQELKDCQSVYDTEKKFVSRQNDQIIQLKDFISTLENSHKDAIRKIEAYQVTDCDKDLVIKKMREEISSYRKQLSMSEKLCGEGVLDKENVVKMLEGRRYELSRRNDEIMTLKNSLKIYMKEIEDYKGRFSVLQESEEKLKRMWRDTEIERSRLEEMNRVLKSRQ